MIIKNLKVPIYKQKLILIGYVKGQSLLDWVLKTYKENLDADPDDYDGGFFEHNGVQHIVFPLSSAVTPGVIAHECKHAVNHTFTEVKMGLDPYNDEAECYLLTWYVDEVHKFWDKIKKENPNKFK